MPQTAPVPVPLRPPAVPVQVVVTASATVIKAAGRG